MKVELDTAAKALYLRLHPGRVVDHGELAEFVVANYGNAGGVLGIEFVRAEDFGPFILEHPELVALPSRLAYVSVDRGVSWDVETGAEDRPPGERERVNAEVHGAFVAELVANPDLVGRIPEGATVMPLGVGAPA